MLITCNDSNFVITEDGKLYSWGKNDYGQLGLGHNVNQNSPQLVDFFGERNVDKIFCGTEYTFAIVNGSLYSWGLNKIGQLGLGHHIDQNRPQIVEFFCDKLVDKIICGLHYTFAITKDNVIYSWGCNICGQLALGHKKCQNLPQLVNFFRGKVIVKIICSHYYIFAIVDDGRVYSWGYNGYGQLGLGNNIEHSLPQLVEFFHNKNVREIICGDYHIFAITNDGRVYSWGKNDYGQLGLGNNVGKNLPQLVDFFRDNNFDKIVSSYDCTFAMMSDGRLYSWGNNCYSQLGLGNRDNQNLPKLVDSIQNKIIYSIFCNIECTFAIIEDGCLYAWGANYDDRLGLGHNHYQHLPQIVDFIRDKKIHKIICGASHTFAIVDNGCIYSWGLNYDGQLGLGNNNRQNRPQLIDFFCDKKIRPMQNFSRVKSANSCFDI